MNNPATTPITFSQLYQLCAANQDLKLERNSQEVIWKRCFTWIYFKYFLDN